MLRYCYPAFRNALTSGVCRNDDPGPLCYRPVRIARCQVTAAELQCHVLVEPISIRNLSIETGVQVFEVTLRIENASLQDKIALGLKR
jgi:hypothetical protein